jgi:hypothetical protein
LGGLVPASETPNKEAVHYEEVEYFEEYLIWEYIDSRIAAYSLACLMENR